MIDLGLAPFVERVVDEASAAGAAAIMLKIDTSGGRVDAAVFVRDALLRTNVKTMRGASRSCAHDAFGALPRERAMRSVATSIRG